MKMRLPRSLEPRLRQDLEEKIVLLAGPRQVGRTFLSKELFPARTAYLSYDSEDDRAILHGRAWDRGAHLVVFDEIHKMRQWKRWLKGVYDTEGVRPRLLVTGSARLDVARKGGESLAGRHFLLRLHPLSVAELARSGLPEAGEPDRVLGRLLEQGGFPEPFLKNDAEFSRRWRKSHLDRILREDLIDLEPVRDVKSIEVLTQLLSERVGSTVSYSSLARDLQVSPHTVKHWIAILESLFVVFVLTPYSKNIAKSLLKEPKVYFYDTARVRGDAAARFENLVACALLKRCHFLEDVHGEDVALHYVRDREKREIDFLTVRDGKPELLVEAKLADTALSPSLRYYAERLRPAQALQAVRSAGRATQYGTCRVVPAADWLAGLES